MQGHNRWKRVLPLLLAVTFLFSTVPIPALVEGEAPADVTEPTETTAPAENAAPTETTEPAETTDTTEPEEPAEPAVPQEMISMRTATM